MGFNLDDYEPVAARLARWLEAHPDGQVLTEMLSAPGADVCVFKTTLLIAGTPVASGHAEEIRGQGNVNRTSHVENCETSSTGRALANAGVAGSDWTKRASREEMGKVQRGDEGGAVPVNRGFGPQPNKYAGKCIRCGGQVPAERGLRDKDGDKWVTFHKDGECATDEEPF